jgi:iron complex outermembrane receptor protein
MRLLFTFFLFLSGYFVTAQKITGSVKDDQGKALTGATVVLQRVKDSSTVKIAVTNSSGQYTFLNIQAGNYFISSSHVSYTNKRSAIFEINGSDVAIPEIVLEKSGTDLADVVVTSKKPMVEVKADKTILNVEGTINSTGNDALELLRKAPGVLLDKDDNISLAGKNGVRIYVDGKQTPLSGADLAAYLKNIQSSEIEAIEIITNPSAKYDAAGNAGIINLRLKKNKSFGTNGSVNLGYGIAINPKYNSGLALNHRNKKINVFGNLNYNRNRNQNLFRLYREQLDTVFSQVNKGLNRNESFGFKGGLDYFINNKHTLGILVNGNLGNNSSRTNSRTPIVYKPTNETSRVLTANNSSDADRDNANFNINYRFADTAGHELNVDADYGIFRIRTDQMQPNIYYTPDMTTELSRAIYNFISPTDIDIYTLKADYEQRYKGGRLGLGFKTSLVNTSNNFGRYNVIGSSKQLDLARSNQFDYKENINAVYVNYNKAYPKKGFIFQAGLRLENTNNNGDSYG